MNEPSPFRVTVTAIDRFLSLFPDHSAVDSLLRSRLVPSARVLAASRRRTNRAMVCGATLERRYYSDRETGALWIAVPDHQNAGGLVFVTAVKMRV